jgi:hypothetical protein
MGRFLIAIEVLGKNSRSVGIFSIEIQAENREAARAALLKHNPSDVVDTIKFCNIQITAITEGGG